MGPYLLLAVAIFAEVVATSALKATAGFTRLAPSILVVVGYGTSFYCLALALRTLQLGFSYAMWSGLGIVFTALAGVVFYQERIDLAGALGMGLIIAGIVVLNVFSKTASH